MPKYYTVYNAYRCKCSCLSLVIEIPKIQCFFGYTAIKQSSKTDKP